ncbi:hypothetical protein DFH28DRAFT_1112048 [Melampsora americana]|nr:hypothetical protein DFH28DRAFT_1112048 [Melampsora americana]
MDESGNTGLVGVRRKICLKKTNLNRPNVKVKCPTSTHYYRTFKLNQLNYKIASINSRKKYTFPYNPSAHGPPVNIDGVVLCDPPSPSEQNKAGPPKIYHAHAKQGPTADKHKPKWHAGCMHKYCRSCCHAFGPPGKCYVHRHQAPLAFQLANQCLQSVGQVRCLFTNKGKLGLAMACQEKEELARKASTPWINPGKVISLHVVTTPFKTPVITQYFPSWPVAALEDYQPLLRKAKAAAGPTWPGQILVWNKKVSNWLYHQKPGSTLPSQRLTILVDLQDVLEGLGLGKPLVPKRPTPKSPDSLK